MLGGWTVSLVDWSREFCICLGPSWYSRVAAFLVVAAEREFARSLPHGRCKGKPETHSSSYLLFVARASV